MKNQFVIVAILCMGFVQYSFMNTPKENEIVKCIPVDIGCLEVGRENAGELVIRSNQEYQKLLLRPSKHVDCANYELPQVDFNKYVLIGYVKGFSGCKEPMVSHSVRLQNGGFEFDVNVEQIGACKRLNWVIIWCMVEKITANPTVKFNENITISL